MDRGQPSVLSVAGDLSSLALYPKAMMFTADLTAAAAVLANMFFFLPEMEEKKLNQAAAFMGMIFVVLW